ncbi:MAG: hypothetical protein F083_3001, partial [bacterium F083]
GRPWKEEPESDNYRDLLVSPLELYKN